jgi:Pumilio-family RNA binding repeat
MASLQVVQYILDLNDNRFSDGVIRQFTGNVCALSVQKFSSNVIEKCIRVAEHNTRKMLIDELLNRTRLEKLLRDSYGNYCVQVRSIGFLIMARFLYSADGFGLRGT